MNLSEEVLRNLGPIAKHISDGLGYEIDYINPQKEEKIPVYVMLTDKTRFEPTEDQIVQAWAEIREDVIASLEPISVDLETENTALRTRVSDLESRLLAIETQLKGGKT